MNILWGFLLWGAATLLFCFFGHLFLIPGNLPIFLLTFLLAVPLIAGATYPYYHVRALSGSKRVIAAVQIAIPGMMLDIFSIFYFKKVFPNLHADSLPIFAAWLLWAYSLILISGFPLKGK